MVIREKIKQAALSLFIQYGVKSVTMDEIAKSAAVSKKTIYQNFKDKNDLVLEVTKQELGADKEFFDGLLARCDNAIQEVCEIAKHIRQHLAQMNPSLLFDLQKFHADAYNYYCEHKTECFEKSVRANIERGIEEGYYRPNINAKILSRMRMAQAETAFRGEWYPPSEFNLVEVQMCIFEHFILGLVTEKGLKLYNEYLSNVQNEK